MDPKLEEMVPEEKQATSVYILSAQTFLTGQKTHQGIPQNTLLPAIFQY